MIGTFVHENQLPQSRVFNDSCVGIVLSFLPRSRPLAVLTLGSASILCFAQTNVLTYRNDNMRTAQNLSETILTPANVRSATFGKLFTYPVDGLVDAQPLVVSGLTIGGMAGRTVGFVPTENDSVYAFDAVTGATYWKVSVLGAGETPSDSRGCSQVEPTIGITSTPVIDLQSGPHGTVYVVGMTKDSSGGYHHRLHALDITTGAEQFGGPVEIKATYPGTGDNSTNGTVNFDPKKYKERTALLLVNGVIYTSWASHCDARPYTGWSMGYNETTLAQTSVFNFSPNGNEGAIWGAGGGVSADASGNLFFDIANGTFDTTLNSSGFPNMGDYGNAFVKVSLVGGVLTPLDYWTMDNTTSESNADTDLGSGGVLLLPDLVDSHQNIRHFGTGVGKDANVYLFDRDNMGKFDSANNGTLYQELPAALAGGAWSSPAWFNGNLYYGGENDVIRSFPMNPQTLMLGAPTSVSPTAYPYPGASPSISANGTTNGILWTVENNTLAVLHAYDATNLGTELYNSNQAPSGRDQFGPGNKYITPVIVNGTVFVGTPNSVAVFRNTASAEPDPFAGFRQLPESDSEHGERRTCDYADERRAGHCHHRQYCRHRGQSRRLRADQQLPAQPRNDCGKRHLHHQCDLYRPLAANLRLAAVYDRRRQRRREPSVGGPERNGDRRGEYFAVAQRIQLSSHFHRSCRQSAERPD